MSSCQTDMARSSIEPIWDAEQSLRLLHNFTHLLQRRDNFNFGLTNFSHLSERFYHKALVPDYQTKLTHLQQFEIRKIITKLANFVTQQESYLELQNLKLIYISLLRCLHYVFTKTVSQTKDAFYCLNAYKLSILAATVCYDTNDLNKMSWCLKEADFLREHGMSMPFRPTEMEVSYFLNDNFLALLRLFCTQQFSSHEILFSQFRSFQKFELCHPQAELLAQILWNISLEIYKSENFPTGILFLQMAFNFGNQMHGNLKARLIKKVTFLTVATVINLKDRPNPLFLLPANIHGTWEAKLRLAIFYKSEPKILLEVIQCLLSELQTYEKRDDQLRKSFLKVLKLLEDHSYLDQMAKVLEELQWRRSLIDAAAAATSGTSELWIFAEMALRLCLNQNYHEGAYDILQNLAKLPYTAAVNCKSARCILTLAERRIPTLDSLKVAFKWYKALLGIRHHIVSRGYSEQGILNNAIRCGISYGSPKSLEYTSNLLEQIDRSYGFNFQCARRMLLVSVLRDEKAKACEIWMRLEMKYKSANGVEDDWTEALTTLEHCVTASLATSYFEDIAVNCLTAIAFEEKLRSRSAALVVRVIRIHLDVIFASGRENLLVTNKSIDNLIAILISSYLNAKDTATTSSNKFHDSDGMDLWFGNLAWFLGQKNRELRPFQRHQLFKLSYKSFMLAKDRDCSIDKRIRDAIILAVAAGINSFDEQQLPYPIILQRCLEIIRDYHEECDHRKAMLLRLYEFLILCQIGNFGWISEFITRYADNLAYGHQFFEYLSTLASSTFGKFLGLLMPATEQGFVFRGALRTSRTLKSQLKLNMVAVACLKISIELILKEEQTPKSQWLLNVSEKWKKAFMILSNGFTYCKENEEQLFKLFLEFLRFVKMALDSHHSIEINEFFNFCCNAVMEMKICKSSENYDRWVELLEDFGSISRDIQKQLRIFKREHF